MLLVERHYIKKQIVTLINADLNADLNGSLNIGRKVFGDNYLTNRGCVVHPVKINIQF